MRLVVPVILHFIAEMVQELRFDSRDFNSLTAGLSTFQLFAKTTKETDKPCNKYRLWDKALGGNNQMSTSERMCMIALDGTPAHINWVSSESST